MQGVSILIYIGITNGKRLKMGQFSFDKYQQITKSQTASQNPYLKTSFLLPEMHLVWSNQGRVYSRCGSNRFCASFLPFYSILFFIFYLFKSHVLPCSKERRIDCGICWTSAKWECQNPAIWSAASHGIGIRPDTGAGSGQLPGGHAVSSCIKTG